MARDIKIRSVAIIGAVAMKAAYASMFDEASGFLTSFVAMAEKYRVPAPANTVVLHTLKAMEEWYGKKEEKGLS